MDRRRFLLSAAAPLVLGAVPALGARRGGTPLALVTADLEGAVVAVHITTGRVLRRLVTPADPRSIESLAGTAALVAHTASGRLTLIDGPSLALEEIAGTFEAPRYTAARPDGRVAYVSDSSREEVVVVDVRRRRAVARLRVGGPARHLSLSPSGRRLWVSLGTKADRIAIVALDEPLRPRLVTSFRPPFLAHDVGFAPNGREVWVTSGDRGRVAVYDARGGLVRSLAADAPPQHVSFLGGRAFVTSGDDAILRVHRRSDGRLLRSTALPVGSYNVQQGFGVVLTPSLSQGTLCVVSESGAVVERRRVARSSHDACFVMSR